MKKLLLILLCLPLFLFSQEERENKKTMSFSQFAKELKEASNKGVGYTLKNCMIVANQADSIEFIIENLEFKDNTDIIIQDCKFDKSIQFRNSIFYSLNFIDVNVQKIVIDSIDVNNELVVKNEPDEFENQKIELKNSVIHWLNASGAYTENLIDDISSFTITGNKIDYTSISGYYRVDFKRNTVKCCYIGYHWKTEDRRPKIGKALIYHNTFTSTFGMISGLNIEGKKRWHVNNYAGLIIRCINFDVLFVHANIFENINQLDNPLEEFVLNIKNVRRYGNETESDVFSHIELSELVMGNVQYDALWDFDKRMDFLKEFQKNNDVEISFSFPSLDISNCEIQNLSISNDPAAEWYDGSILANHIDYFYFIDNNIISDFKIIHNTIDSVSVFSGNTLPTDIGRIKIDKNFIESLGFLYHNKSYYGTESFKEIEEIYHNSEFKESLDDLMLTQLKILRILELQGSDLRNDVFRKIKQIKKAKSEYDYQFSKPDLEKWFLWKGSQFLDWYSDYGMNPFKALSYCFKAMLWFALFYFFFYSDWDKIDRRFLIKRFNSVMDYFTTQKRIQDFYSSTHDKEMTTFTEFKKTLDKNRIYMPTMLGTLAKPIYQISLLRYKLLNFSYKRAEFMAGRKWVDLKKKDRYLIGTLTFFLTIFYIIYLIIIRSLNSIVLSINAFSTLGFGQIPVRGFTKYVAIIEGFIGWFMLSVFIVSLLSQMMSV
jgi:hypothetical protein